MCEWINTKSFRDIYEFGTCWILQLPAPHHIHFKPSAGRRDQIFSFGILFSPWVIVAGDRGCSVPLSGQRKDQDIQLLRLQTVCISHQVHVWTIAGQLPPWTEKILKSQLFHFLPVSDFSFFSRVFPIPSPLSPLLTVKSCEEKQAKSGKMCSHLTHATFVSSITQSH